MLFSFKDSKYKIQSNCSVICVQYLHMASNAGKVFFVKVHVAF